MPTWMPEKDWKAQITPSNLALRMVPRVMIKDDGRRVN